MFIAIDAFVERGGVEGACSGSSTAVELPVMLLVTLLFRVLVGEYSLLMMFIKYNIVGHVIMQSEYEKIVVTMASKLVS